MERAYFPCLGKLSYSFPSFYHFILCAFDVAKYIWAFLVWVFSDVTPFRHLYSYHYNHFHYLHRKFTFTLFLWLSIQNLMNGGSVNITGICVYQNHAKKGLLCIQIRCKIILRAMFYLWFGHHTLPVLDKTNKWKISGREPYNMELERMLEIFESSTLVLQMGCLKSPRNVMSSAQHLNWFEILKAKK